MIDWLIGWLIDQWWLIEWMIDWWLMDRWLFDDWLMDRYLIDDWWIDWSIDWSMVDWLILIDDWSINWSINRLMVENWWIEWWLIDDRLIDLQFSSFKDVRVLDEAGSDILRILVAPYGNCLKYNCLFQVLS